MPAPIRHDNEARMAAIAQRRAANDARKAAAIAQRGQRGRGRPVVAAVPAVQPQMVTPNAPPPVQPTATPVAAAPAAAAPVTPTPAPVAAPVQPQLPANTNAVFKRGGKVKPKGVGIAKRGWTRGKFV